MKLYSLLFAVILFVSCNNLNDSAFKTSTAESGLGDEKVIVSSNEYISENSPDQEQKIIKTGNLVFETQQVAKTHNNILMLAKQYDAIIQQDVSGKDYNSIFQEMTVRIPSKNFQVFVDGISKGVVSFDKREISQRDVSEEFIDIEARLTAKRELQKRYLELLKKAKNVEEILEIERELSLIREEIEAKQGRLKYLQRQVSMSTVNITFYKATVESKVTESYGGEIKKALQGGWNGISSFFITILYIWPLFVLAIIGILVSRWLARRRKKSREIK